jgi:hypothetical protein
MGMPGGASTGFEGDAYALDTIFVIIPEEGIDPDLARKPIRGPFMEGRPARMICICVLPA